MKSKIKKSKTTIKVVNKKKAKINKLKIKEIIKLNKPHKNNKSVCNLEDNVIIKLENVEKYLTNGYNFEHVLKGIDLTIYKGEFVVIVGPSGSGKTTLLTILSALDRPTNGNCYMFGKNTISLKNHELTKLRANYVGYIFQQYGLLPDLNVIDNIKLASKIKKDYKDSYDVNELIKMVDLEEHKEKKAMNLSGGQSQRVAICRALVKKPDILFGDEPTGALHVDASKKVMEIFTKVNQENKTTVVIVTHNNAIKELADRIIVIENGLIKENFINPNKKTVDEIVWDIDEQ